MRRTAAQYVSTTAASIPSGMSPSPQAATRNKARASPMKSWPVGAASAVALPPAGPAWTAPEPLPGVPGRAGWA